MTWVSVRVHRDDMWVSVCVVAQVIGVLAGMSEMTSVGECE